MWCEGIEWKQFRQVSGAFSKIMALKNQRDAVRLFASRVVQVMLTTMSNVENRMTITGGGLEILCFYELRTVQLDVDQGVAYPVTR